MIVLNVSFGWFTVVIRGQWRRWKLKNLWFDENFCSWSYKLGRDGLVADERFAYGKSKPFVKWTILPIHIER